MEMRESVLSQMLTPLGCEELEAKEQLSDNLENILHTELMMR